jgi:molecular chaperone DnaK (HSP70)
MIPMIKKNTNVPFKKVKTFHTIKDNQTDFGIGIYEGEEKLIKDNILLDTFYLRNITKAPKGETKMEITFDVDENGILNVTAKEKGNNNEKKIKVERGNEEIDNLINEQIKFINEKYFKKGQSLKYLKN